jgi:hypothetical protein
MNDELDGVPSGKTTAQAGRNTCLTTPLLLFLPTLALSRFFAPYPASFQGLGARSARYQSPQSHQPVAKPFQKGIISHVISCFGLVCISLGSN